MFKRWFSAPGPITDALAEEATPIPLHHRRDTRRAIVLGATFVGLGLAAFVYWGLTARLDEGVPTSGVLTVDSKRKTVSHFSGGVVRQILVREAQRVEPNQSLIVLDDTAVRAAHDTHQQTWFSLKATEARLMAEQEDASAVRFPADMVAMQHPLAEVHMATQRTLFTARRGALSMDLVLLEETARGNEAQARASEEQLTLLKRELSGIRELAEEGYASRNQQLQLERQASELSGAAQRARQAAVEARLRAKARQSDYRREVQTELAETRREAANAFERVVSARAELERSIIRSPVQGYVTGLAMHTVGGVVTPGMRLMDVVPADDKLTFEVRLPSHLVERVRAGLPADINLRNFPDDPRMVIDGRVVSVSADVVSDANNPDVPPFYLARVEVTEAGTRKLGRRRLQAGMGADVMIKTGERTMFVYLLKPLVRRLQSALTEQ